MSTLGKTLQSAGIGLGSLLSWRARRDAVGANLLEINLAGPLEEVQLSGLWQRFLPASLTMRELLFGISLASEIPSIRALLIRVSDHDLGWGRMDELCEALRRFRGAGKQAIAFLEQPENIDTMLAAACDRVVVPPGSLLHLTGLMSEVIYFKGMLDKLEIKPELYQAGKYKSAVEPFTREGMSRAHREAVEYLLDGIFEHWVNSLAQGRGLEPATVKKLIDDGPWSAERAREQGLIDETLYEDQLDDYLEKWLGITPRRLELGKFLRLFSPPPSITDPWKKTRALAIISASGPIHAGESRYLGAGDATVGADTLREAISFARENDQVAAVILRIDSPGGSAVHSDLIWREVERLREQKPVVVSMADVAASGGYYIAMPADHLLATPFTITGSIGVIGGKINLKGLYTKVGLKKEHVRRGRHADMESDYGPYSTELKLKLKNEMETIYRTFVEKAAKGRKREPRELEQSAQGRVWTGSQARDRGLLDELGGLLTAIDRAKERAGIPLSRKVPVFVLPRIKKLSLPSLPFSLPLPSGIVRAAGQLSIYEILAREPSLALMPFKIRIK